MLVEIAKFTAGSPAILLHPDDNVAVALAPLSAGAEVRLADAAIRALEAIPAGHKIARRAIPAGALVLRYGQPIGRAKEDIAAGRHVHTHNLRFEDREPAYEFPQGDIAPPAPAANAPAFLGYAREDGRVGTRNYIAAVAASNCAAHVAAEIARSYERAALPEGVDGVVAFPHGEGCGHAHGPDMEQLRRTLGGVLNHPNVSAAVIVGLGCEDNQIADYLDGARASRLAGLTLQTSGGSHGAVEAARREIDRFIERAAAEKRVETPVSKIVLGLNCGGSDSFSGITANPALGFCSDLLAGFGGTAVLAETPEIFGAEHLLVKRARSRAVAERLLDCIRSYRAYLERFGASFEENPSPGNRAGGISTILEKSLGAAAKAGTSPLMEVYGYAESVASPGFCFMNTPGYDPVSLAGLAAGGCNLIAFTTGRGSAIGFPTVPVLKIASNSGVFRGMRGNMDLNAGAIADGEKDVSQMGREIFNLLIETASGRRTAAERAGHAEFVPWRIGPVM